MDIYADNGGARDGLGHDRAVQLAEWRLQKQLAALADQCPDHTISTESYPGRGRRFVARARPGTAARPWLILTPTWTNFAPPCLAADALDQGAEEFPGLVIVDASGVGAGGTGLR